MLGIAAASSEVIGYGNLTEVIEKIGKCGDKVFCPKEENVATYDKLYEEYKTLLEYFGKGTNDVMKRLNRIRG